jgi:CRISPR/Cas system-associated exonuclease Cas4 (RecB family)
VYSIFHNFSNNKADKRSRECLRHEEYDHFRIEDTRITVKVDFVGSMPDGTLVLTDWKTSWDDDEYETELQMAAYVLWAMVYYRKSADEISTELVFLKTGATKPYRFFEEQLHDVQEQIPREFAMMNASYEYGDFPVRPSQRECLSCTFAEVCPERKM